MTIRLYNGGDERCRFCEADKAEYEGENEDAFICDVCLKVCTKFGAMRKKAKWVVRISDPDMEAMETWLDENADRGTRSITEREDFDEGANPDEGAKANVYFANANVYFLERSEAEEFIKAFQGTVEAIADGL